VHNSLSHGLKWVHFSLDMDCTWRLVFFSQHQDTAIISYLDVCCHSHGASISVFQYSRILTGFRPTNIVLHSWILLAMKLLHLTVQWRTICSHDISIQWHFHIILFHSHTNLNTRPLDILRVSQCITGFTRIHWRLKLNRWIYSCEISSMMWCHLNFILIFWVQTALACLFNTTLVQT